MMMEPALMTAPSPMRSTLPAWQISTRHGADKGIALDDDASAAFGVRQDDAPEAQHGVLVNFHAFWIFIFQVNVVTDENGPGNLDTAQAVQRRAQGCAARTGPGQRMKRPVNKSA